MSLTKINVLPTLTAIRHSILTIQSFNNEHVVNSFFSFLTVNGVGVTQENK